MDTGFEGQHQPLKVRRLCVYLMSLNLLPLLGRSQWYSFGTIAKAIDRFLISIVFKKLLMDKAA